MHKPTQPTERESSDLLFTAALVRLFDKTGNAEYVASQMGVTTERVLAVVLADTRRSLAPRGPGKASHGFFAVLKRKVA